MHTWIEAANQLDQQGDAYVIVTVLGAHGSTPRDSGTKMVVALRENHGSIGGGHLEFQAIAVAKHMLQEGWKGQHLETFPLGSGLGQCCGGSVTLLFEYFPGHDFNIIIFGAGHVGTALVDIMKQLPCRLKWVDARDNQHSSPDALPPHVIPIVSESPPDEVASMPPKSYYIILTYNHQMDFDILEAVLKRRDARYVGLIGSTTKWKRFTMRLEHRGYDEQFYKDVHCPIGLASVPGKHPMEVAVSIAAEVIGIHHSTDSQGRNQVGISWPELKVAVNSITSMQLKNSN